MHFNLNALAVIGAVVVTLALAGVMLFGVDILRKCCV